MRVCIISGRFPRTRFESYINHKIYADTFGYTYIHCNWPTKHKIKYLNKIEYILSYIDNYDYVIWLDDDAFFFDLEKDIMEFAPKGNSFISLCKSPDFKELKTVFSSGQFIVKSNDISKSFFQDVLKTNIEVVKKWWTPDLGYFTNGDQDLMIYQLLLNEAYLNKFDVHNYKCFNSRCANLFGTDEHNPLILHFTGTLKVKNNDLIKVRKALNMHPSLIPNTLLNRYEIGVLERYTPNTWKSILKSILTSLTKKIVK